MLISKCIVSYINILLLLQVDDIKVSILIMGPVVRVYQKLVGTYGPFHMHGSITSNHTINEDQ